MQTQVSESSLHKRGVFATEKISKGTIIETCNLILLSENDTKKIDDTALYDYYFSWSQGSAIALGNGSLYNHSYEPNAKYVKEFGVDRIVFIALHDILPGEEITVNYNGDPSNKEKVWFEKS